MIGLPGFGQRVRIWPMPGRRVLAAPFATDAPLLTQAMYMPSSGQDVVWDYYWHEQMRAGDILLHPPPCEDHDHGEEGVDDCRLCGRTLAEAQVYNVHYAHGSEATLADIEKARADAERAAKKAAEDRQKEIDDRKKAAAEAVKKAKEKLAGAADTATVARAELAAAKADVDAAQKAKDALMPAKPVPGQ